MSTTLLHGSVKPKTTSGPNNNLYTSTNLTKQELSIMELLKITDENPKIKTGENINVFSTNIFLPLTSNVTHKTFMYLSGMVKLVETFQERIDMFLKGQKWMLFIYYDNMFNQEYDDLAYEYNNNNNSANKDIKSKYQKEQKYLKIVHSITRNYIDKIKHNKAGKYNFIKLYSFNYVFEKKNRHNYLGHPDTFGSFIRFLPLFDVNVSRFFSINISHAISPNMCFLINKWIDSNKILFTNGNNNYIYYDEQFKEMYEVIGTVDPPRKKIAIRMLAGFFGFYKNPAQNSQQFLLDQQFFIKVIKTLIDYENLNPTTSTVFSYGIDEVLLGYIFGKNVEQVLDTNNDNLNNNIEKKNNYFFNIPEDQIYFLDKQQNIEKERHFNPSQSIISWNAVPSLIDRGRVESIIYVYIRLKQKITIASIINNFKDNMSYKVRLIKKIRHLLKTIINEINKKITNKLKNIITMKYEDKDINIPQIEDLNNNNDDYYNTDGYENNKIIKYIYRSLMVNVKYDDCLYESEMKIIKSKIDSLYQNLLGEIRKLFSNKFLNNSFEEHYIMNNLIKFTDIIKNSCSEYEVLSYEISESRFAGFYKQKRFYGFNNISEMIQDLYDFTHNHRFVSRSFIKYIGFFNRMVNFHSKLQNDVYIDFGNIFDSFDEEKPLIIYNPTNDESTFYEKSLGFSRLSQDFYTFYNYENENLLVELIDYYNDRKKVVIYPYTEDGNIEIDEANKILKLTDDSVFYKELSSELQSLLLKIKKVTGQQLETHLETQLEPHLETQLETQLELDLSGLSSLSGLIGGGYKKNKTRKNKNKTRKNKNKTRKNKNKTRKNKNKIRKNKYFFSLK